MAGCSIQVALKPELHSATVPSDPIYTRVWWKSFWVLGLCGEWCCSLIDFLYLWITLPTKPFLLIHLNLTEEMGEQITISVIGEWVSEFEKLQLGNWISLFNCVDMSNYLLIGNWIWFSVLCHQYLYLTWNVLNPTWRHDLFSFNVTIIQQFWH